jgi:hypothetical protein
LCLAQNAIPRFLVGSHELQDLRICETDVSLIGKNFCLFTRFAGHQLIQLGYGQSEKRKVMYRSRDTSHDVQRKFLSVCYDLRLEAIDPVFPREVSPGFLERRDRPSPLLDRAVDDKSVGPVIGAGDT